jgi:hypothetical protein
MNKSTLKILLGLLAFLLAGCAGFFSITGLSMLFAGAALPVIIMAGALEFSKLVAASFLYQYWKKISFVLKAYLTIAVVILAIITSMGIYGFLSNAYQQTKIEYNLAKTSTDSLTNKKSSFEFQISNLNKQLDLKNTQLEGLNSNSKTSDQVLSTLATNNRNINSISKNSARTQTEISKLNSNIDTILNKITVLQDSVYAYDVAIKSSALNASKTSELGPLEYLSNVLNTDMDKIVNWFILLFVIVFDPLAMALLIAFNFLSKKEEPIENTIDILTINDPIDTVLDDHIQPEIIEQPTISKVEETEVKQNETPEIIKDNSVSESIYEESNKNKSFGIKKPGSKIGYAGGISN